MLVRLAIAVAPLLVLATTSAFATGAPLLGDQTRLPLAAAMSAIAEAPGLASPAEQTSGKPSLRSMIGQMILIGFPGTRPQDAGPARVLKLIQDGRIGGVVLYDYNVVSPRQLKALNAAFNRAGGELPPFICIDQEGGSVQRLSRAKGFIGLPGASRISGMNLDKASELDAGAARELAELGFNVNFGPVVDVNVNPMNPVIGRLGRSFGADPSTVVTYASAFIDAHEKSGVLTVVKHFPGHGSGLSDPHSRIVDISKTWRPSELVPYESLIGGGGVDMVMVGHLIAPDFSDDGNVPASLSRRAIQEQLRGNLHFRGLVVTDDLDMGAIRRRYPVEQAAVLAIAAGADLVIANDSDPAMANRIIAAVVQAVADGRIERAQIEDAYRLIVARKMRLLSEPRSFAGSNRL